MQSKDFHFAQEDERKREDIRGSSHEGKGRTGFRTVPRMTPKEETKNSLGKQEGKGLRVSVLKILKNRQP